MRWWHIVIRNCFMLWIDKCRPWPWAVHPCEFGFRTVRIIASHYFVLTSMQKVVLLHFCHGLSTLIFEHCWLSSHRQLWLVMTGLCTSGPSEAPGFTVFWFLATVRWLSFCGVFALLYLGFKAHKLVKHEFSCTIAMFLFSPKKNALLLWANVAALMGTPSAPYFPIPPLVTCAAFVKTRAVNWSRFRENYAFLVKFWVERWRSGELKAVVDTGAQRNHRWAENQFSYFN